MEQLEKKFSYDKIFVCVLSFFILCWITGMIFNPAEQYTLFFRSCGNFLADFTNIIAYSADLDPYNNTLNGPAEHGGMPLAYVIFYIFSKIVPRDAISLGWASWQNAQVMVIVLIFLSLCTSLLFTQIYDMKKGNKIIRALVAFVMIFSGTFLFLIERGNIKILAIVQVFFFITCHDSKNKIIKELSFLNLAFAAIIQFLPTVLGLILVYKGKTKDALRLIVYGLSAAFLPFLVIKGGFSNIPIMFKNININLVVYKSINDCGIPSATSRIFSYISAANPELAASESYTSLATSLPDILQVFSVIIAVILLVNIPFQNEKWRKYISLCMIMIMIPSHSGSYNVIYLFPAIIMFLNEKKHKPADIVYLICFLLLLNPFQINVIQYLYYNMYTSFLFIFMGVEGTASIIANRNNIIPVYKELWKKITADLKKHSAKEPDSNKNLCAIAISEYVKQADTKNGIVKIYKNATVIEYPDDVDENAIFDIVSKIKKKDYK